MELSVLHRPKCVGSNQCFQASCEKKAEIFMKSDTARKETTIAGQSIDIEWHVCLGDTSVPILHEATRIRRRPGTQQRVFQTGSSSRACSTTSPTGKGIRCKISVQFKREKWLLTMHGSELVLGVLVVQDQKRPGHVRNIDHLTSLQTVNVTSSLSG